MKPTKPLLALAVMLALAACGGADRPGTALPVPTSTADFAMRNALAKQAFGAEQYASAQSPAPLGSYAKGCLAGAVQLAETGPTWQAMRLNRNRNWGHPEMIAYVQRLSQKAAALPGWNGIYVGDISQPRGGPMLTGHASHQIGLDADIWLLPATRLDLNHTERESLSSISLRRANGAYVNDQWTRQHHELLKMAASDPDVARIFIFPGAKAQMCRDETGDRAWLNKVRPWYGHHYHFHVRLKCPKGASGCVDQDTQPAGDGCAEAQDWVNNILNPPPPDPNYRPGPPKAELRLADLPGTVPIRSVALILALIAGLTPTAQAAGAELLSRFVWRSDNPLVGGISGLELSDDGTEFVAISDRGAIATGRLLREAGAITAIGNLEIKQLRDPGGKPVRGKARDAEGLAMAADGTLFVSYEGQHRVWRYARFGAAAQALPSHPDFADFPLNSGLEALAIDRTGALYTLPERSGALSQPFALYRFDGKRWSIPYSLPRRGDHLPVGADFGPDCKFYLLERNFSGFLGFSSRVRRFTLGPKGTFVEETLLTTPNLRHGNLEGLSVWRDAAGDIRLTMVADDNFHMLQVTELVEYRVTE